MQLPGLTVGIVADDLTGANDTALQFFQLGCSTKVLLDLHSVNDIQDTQVWAINSESRHLGVHESVAQVRRAVNLLREHYGVENFYKKIDSTLRGNIAHECLAMLDELKAECVAIVPAYPDENRRTVGGYQLVRGIPVEKTEVARDPLCPVRQSHIPTLLEQSTKAPNIIGHIQLSTVMHGAGPILVALGEQMKAGKKLVVIDACTNVDLDQIALALEKIQLHHRVIPCGSAGLAQSLTKFWGSSIESQPKPHPNPMGLKGMLKALPLLIACGTNSNLTRTQLKQLQEHYPYYGQGSQLSVFTISPEKILGFDSVDQDIQEIIDAMGTQNTVIVSISLDTDNYMKTMALAEAHDIPSETVTVKGQEILSKIVKAVLQEKPAHLVFSGGETATHICKGLSSKLLKLMGMAEQAIPLMQDDHGRWIVTKSGNFGSNLAMANIVQYFKSLENFKSLETESP
jgi:D-threonate/D-erythronate kinase